MSTAVSPSIDAPARRAPDVGLHVALLSVASCMMLLSCLLRIADGQRVIIPLLDIPLPGVCTYQQWFELPCPGCGLTRCFISLGHADLVAAWHFNPAGLLGFLLVAAQIPYRIIQLWRVRVGKSELRLAWLGQWLFWTFVALLLAQWLWRTFT